MRILMSIIAALGIFFATLAFAAPASASTTPQVCSPYTGVPGATGSFRSCGTFITSADQYGRAVARPNTCTLDNQTNKNLNWYREAWTFSTGSIAKTVAYGAAIAPGVTTVSCASALYYWMDMSVANYVRASVQVTGGSGTSGANHYAPRS